MLPCYCHPHGFTHSKYQTRQWFHWRVILIHSAFFSEAQTSCELASPGIDTLQKLHLLCNMSRSLNCHAKPLG